TLTPNVANAILRRSEISRWQLEGVYVNWNAVGASITDNRIEIGPGSVGILSDSKGTSNDVLNQSPNTVQLKGNVIRATSSGITLGARPDAVSGNVITGVGTGYKTGVYAYDTQSTSNNWSEATNPTTYPTITLSGNTITGFCNGVVNQIGHSVIVLEGNN